MSAPNARLAFACCLAAVGLAACGTTAKPLAGTQGILNRPGNHALLDDPRIRQSDHVACLKQHHITVALVGQSDLRIGMAPSGPYVHFTPTPGVAQGDQISGEAKYEGAEVIGAALLWPNEGSRTVLKTVEDCLAQGVSG
jgi:hypothetical protein